MPSARYTYDGMRFDSMTELAYWIFKADSGSDIRRGEEKDRLEFEFKGKKIGYCCDFIEGGIRIELKGDQFFRPDGTMYCPYRKKSQTDEQYAEICELYEAKHQRMIRNEVKILRYSSDEVQSAIVYVKDRYGKKYLEQFRIRN